MKIPTNLRWKPTNRTLGQGGQAAVVEVKDAEGEFEGTFALKALSPGKPQKAYARFSREIDGIKSVSHPSIIRIVDHADHAAAFHYYVMESPEGATSLKKLLGSPNNPFHRDPPKALSMFIELASAIKACEAVGVVHRDLSPANVLVLRNESIKIIDFGICQLADTGTITLVDEGVGTPNYTAPECESGADEDITAAADIYSAGKLLWSAITNFHAFAREAPVFDAQSMNRIFPDDPRAWHLHHIFENTVRHDLGNRWQSATDAVKAARRVQFLLASGYPPLEFLQDRCPICGVGEVGSFQGSHTVFGNPNPSGIASFQCTYCGFCFPRNMRVAQDNIQKRSQLR
jgi:serine/threonine protein kinase